MRTLYEIINDAKDGKMPTHEECYYGMLAYESLLNFDHTKLRTEMTSDKPTSPIIKKMISENSFAMYKGALDKSPQAWLGTNHDPINKGYQEMRKLGNKLFDKAVKNLDLGNERHTDSKKLIESYINLANKVPLSKTQTSETYGLFPNKHMSEDDIPLALSNQMVETLDLLQYIVNCNSWTSDTYHTYDADNIKNRLVNLEFISDKIINSEIP